MVQILYVRIVFANSPVILDIMIVMRRRENLMDVRSKVIQIIYGVRGLGGVVMI
jgi:hypothetical protein